jgi:hypothetical protein
MLSWCGSWGRFQTSVSRVFGHCRPYRGDVAQLGERLVCNQEVEGSIPFVSILSLSSVLGYDYRIALQVTRRSRNCSLYRIVFGVCWFSRLLDLRPKCSDFQPVTRAIVGSDNLACPGINFDRQENMSLESMVPRYRYRARFLPGDLKTDMNRSCRSVPQSSSSDDGRWKRYWPQCIVLAELRCSQQW